MNTSSVQSIDKKIVLAKAFFNTGKQFNFTQTQLATILGISEPTINRLGTELGIDPASKQGEIALLFISLFSALYDLTGGDSDWIQHFLKSKNRVTGGVPMEQIETVRGLTPVYCVMYHIQGCDKS